MNLLRSFFKFLKLLSYLSIEGNQITFEYHSARISLDVQGNLTIRTEGYYSVEGQYIFQNCDKDFIDQTLKQQKPKLSLHSQEQECLVAFD